MRPKADSLGEKGEKVPVHPSGLKGRENLCPDQLNFGSAELLAALQAALMILSSLTYPGLLTQGIGLRPKPWARISRPVGPVLLGALDPVRTLQQPAAQMLTANALEAHRVANVPQSARLPSGAAWG